MDISRFMAVYKCSYYSVLLLSGTKRAIAIAGVVDNDVAMFQAVGSKAGAPSQKVVIADCGEFV